MAPHGHGNGGVAGEKARDFKGTMKKLMSYLANYKIAIFFVAVFAVGSTILDFFSCICAAPCFRLFKDIL